MTKEHRDGMIAPGTKLEHYQIISMLGAGGMGEVYLAQDMRLGRKVALKMLLPELTGDGRDLRRFEHEARAASALNHPNILTIYEFGQELVAFVRIVLWRSVGGVKINLRPEE